MSMNMSQKGSRKRKSTETTEDMQHLALKSPAPVDKNNGIIETEEEVDTSALTKIYQGGCATLYESAVHKDRLLKVCDKDCSPAEYWLHFVATKLIPNYTCQIYRSYRSHKGEFVIEMENAKGQTWASCTRLFLQEPVHAIVAVRQLMDALATLHAWDFIHGDLHEWNLLYVPELFRINLIDFGFASLGERGYAETSSLKKLNPSYSFARLRMDFGKHSSYSKSHDWYSMVLSLRDVLSASYRTFFSNFTPKQARQPANVLFVNEMRILLEQHITSSRKGYRKCLHSEFCITKLKNHMWFDATWQAPIFAYWGEQIRKNENWKDVNLDKLTEAVTLVERKYYDGKLSTDKATLDKDEEVQQLSQYVPSKKKD